MKISILFLILALQSGSSLADLNMICSDKLDLVIGDSIKSSKAIIHAGENLARLTIKINGIESLNVSQISFAGRKAESCNYENAIMKGSAFINFNKPINVNKLELTVPVILDFYNKRHYLFRVSKTINGKKVYYFKIFNFSVDRDY